MNKKLTAVVLAGGTGSRFWPFTKPKTLFPFFGKTLFDYSVMTSLPAEIDNIVVVSNSENKEAFGAIKLPKPMTIVLQPQPLGMADALLCAQSELHDRRLVVIIADDVSDPLLLGRVLGVAKKKKDAFAVIAGWKTEKYFPGGYLRVDGDRVLGIVEKPLPDAIPSPYVAISGQYIADSNVFLSELKHAKGDADDRYEQAMTMLALRQKVYVVPYEGMFSALKYPWNVLDMLDVLLHTRLKARKGKNVQIRSNVTIEGAVALGDNVRIFENTKIIGPCYIGDNTIIGNNNIIRESHIGANCVTGFNTDISRSYIGNDCWFHGNYIGDSVLVDDISMGGGARLANLRLDDGEIFSTVKNVRIATGKNKLGAMIGEHVRIGVNTSVMPGIKIGGNTMIGSGIVLDQDIPEGSFVSPIRNSFIITANTKKDNVSREEFKKHL